MVKRKRSYSRKRSFKRRSFKRRRYGRRRFSRKRGGSIFKKYSGLNRLKGRSIGFPKQNVVMMRWEADYNLTAATTDTTIVKQFNANSIYSPDPSISTESRPIGWEQWQTFFSEYMVIGSKITIDIQPLTTNAATGNAPIWAAVGCLPFTGYSTDPMYQARQAGLLGRGVRINTNNPGGSQKSWPSTKIRAYYSPKKYFDLKNIRDTEGLQALFTADPVTLAKFSLCYGEDQALNTADTGATYIRVSIDYLCLLGGPKELSITVP